MYDNQGVFSSVNRTYDVISVSVAKRYLYIDGRSCVYHTERIHVMHSVTFRHCYRHSVNWIFHLLNLAAGNAEGVSNLSIIRVSETCTSTIVTKPAVVTHICKYHKHQNDETCLLRAGTNHPALPPSRSEGPHEGERAPYGSVRLWCKRATQERKAPWR